MVTDKKKTYSDILVDIKNHNNATSAIYIFEP